MKIIKRNGAEVPFDITKIITAVTKASDSVGGQARLSREQITQIAAAVTDQCQQLNRAVSVEEVQDLVENQLMDIQAHDVARHYITYRYVQSLKRQTNTTDERILSLIECQNEEVKQENANKNPTVNSVQRDYMAGEISKDLTARLLLDPEIVKAHQEGLIHFHDSDYFAQHMDNCDLVNLEDMLQNGTVISGTYIEKPHSFSTACNIATQIIAQVASNQYGGQSISLTHLAPFVDVSRKKIAAEVELEMEGLDVSAERKKEIVERRLRNEINRGVQTIQYQVVTLMTTNGQAPFITVFMYLGEARNPQEKADLAIIIEETIRQRYQGVKNEAGVWITPAFPKLIYVLEEDNIRPGTPYYYLTELAAKCTAKRMVPDYISEKKMLELKVDKNGEGHCYTCMGCRSFLTPYVDPETGKPKYYGRFNQGVVTINLVDVALSSGGNFEKFWKIFDERLDLCHRALQARHKRLLGTPSDAAPILWQYGALARLKKGEKIDKLLFGGYSTISLGYAGLYECVKYMTGKSHTDAGAKPFALSVMQHMNDKCNAWKKAENMDYSLYGTPLESTTYKFAKCLQKRFGIVEGITDKNYITNSYHVHVSEPIDAFTKLKFEADFQRLSPGGAISYVEVPNMQDNLEAVISVLQFIYDNIMYAELNTKSDYCQVCGYDGEIKIVEDDGKLVWECPKCGNRDQNKLNVARRTCGYIGTQFWNQGRTQEIKDRVLHLYPSQSTLRIDSSPERGSFLYGVLSMNYANIKYYDIANGPGVRTSVFVSGCRHHCPGCFNAVAWDFAYGQPFDKTVRNEIFASCQPDYIAGLSLLGGEPFEPENQRELLPFVRNFKALYPAKTVWCYSGYTWEQLTGKEPSPARCEVTDELLALLDVLVDGRFVQAEHDISLRFRGSRNQRLLDVPKSLAAGQPVWWEDEKVFATHTMER